MHKPLAISQKTYARRRAQLMRMAGDDAIVIVPAAAQRIRSRDTHYPYRQDSDVLYLSGFPEPEAVVPGFVRLLEERPASGRYGAPALLEGRR